MSYATAFPHIPAADIPPFVLTSGWTDSSFHNDGAAFFVNDASGVGVFVNLADPAARYEDEPDRFAVIGMEDMEGVGWVQSVSEALLYSGDDEREALAHMIGEAFSRKLEAESWFAPMIARNATPEFLYTACCASHDFCDANMPMADAFETIIGRELFGAIAHEEGRCTEADIDSDAELVNRAWDIAREKWLLIERKSHEADA